LYKPTINGIEPANNRSDILLSLKSPFQSNRSGIADCSQKNGMLFNVALYPIQQYTIATINVLK
jgi:hypothetical protein